MSENVEVNRKKNTISSVRADEENVLREFNSYSMPKQIIMVTVAESHL